jgi:hypothetical protein
VEPRLRAAGSPKDHLREPVGSGHEFLFFGNWRESICAKLDKEAADGRRFVDKEVSKRFIGVCLHASRLFEGL